MVEQFPELGSALARSTPLEQRLGGRIDAATGGKLLAYLD